jgi:hypothetical protein
VLDRAAEAYRRAWVQPAAVGVLLGHHPCRDWILPLLQLPLWDEVQVIASERLSCCLTRNVARAFDGVYISPALIQG